MAWERAVLGKSGPREERYYGPVALWFGKDRSYGPVALWGVMNYTWH